MQLHRIVGRKNGAPFTRFSGSLRDASALKEELRKQHGLKRSEILSEPVEVPTTKAELLVFLNAESKQYDNL